MKHYNSLPHPNHAQIDDQIVMIEPNMMNILSSQHHEEEKQQYLDMMFTPYNNMLLSLHGDKSRGANN